MKPALLPIGRIENRILLVRGQKVLLDSDLAALYGVETRVLNQAVKRNLERFPADFMFRLSAKEFENWRSQVVMSKPGAIMGLRRAPFAFTEHGALMAASVLNTLAAGVRSHPRVDEPARTQAPAYRIHHPRREETRLRRRNRHVRRRGGGRGLVLLRYLRPDVLQLPRATAFTLRIPGKTLGKGRQQKAVEFVKKGAEIYQKA